MVGKTRDPNKGENSTEKKPVEQREEEHGPGNYRFAFKVLLILLVIILIIVVLKATGIPIAIRDWLAPFADILPTSFCGFL